MPPSIRLLSGEEFSVPRQPTQKAETTESHFCTSSLRAAAPGEAHSAQGLKRASAETDGGCARPEANLVSEQKRTPLLHALCRLTELGHAKGLGRRAVAHLGISGRSRFRETFRDPRGTGPRSGHAAFYHRLLRAAPEQRRVYGSAFLGLLPREPFPPLRGAPRARAQHQADQTRRSHAGIRARGSSRSAETGTLRRDQSGRGPRATPPSRWPIST